MKFQSFERHVFISSGNFISITTLFSNVFNFSTESVRCRFLARLLFSSFKMKLKKTKFLNNNKKENFYLLEVAVVDDES